MKKKMIFSVVIVLILLFAALLMLEKSNQTNSDKSKVQITTTLFPLYDFAKSIGGEKVEVNLLLPPGVESHSYEPTPQDIIQINESDIFIFTGETMEPWAHDIVEGLDGSLKIIDASSGIEMINLEEGYADIHESEGVDEEYEHEHEHEGIDPHFWLDFNNVKIISENIAKTLSLVDATNLEYYNSKLAEYMSQIDSLDEAYSNSMSSCKSNTIIYGGHYAFGYMAKRYSLNYLAAQGFAPDSEPTAQDIANLINQIRDNNIEYIFYEELSSPRVAQALSNETNTEILLLNAAHNISKDDMEKGASFISIMEENLVNLSKGLGCNN